ncbi:hypothetical protein [Streptosporangium sp. 'caverna']|uniref:hypothetical protein n=1 Tax=Streptosporangium sp. 'caverna' TaxID=2202249 RepID=UPI0013A69773|nr:hypothetical protein [Streptosporangium sp. 'caverna']
MGSEKCGLVFRLGPDVPAPLQAVRDIEVTAAISIRVSPDDKREAFGRLGGAPA